MPFEKDPNEIGALWQKISAKGNEFMSGKIEGVGDVVLFRAKKTSEKSPDWRVLKSQPREAGRFDSRREDTRTPPPEDDTTWG